MIYYGGKVRRSLRANEITGRYSQSEKVDLATLRTTFLDAGYSTIRLNSTYLETADREFDERGVDTFTALVGLSIVFGLIALIVARGISFNDELILPDIGYIALTVVCLLLPLLMGGLLFFKDIFNYTHFPIRFNRKTRMVYLFLRKGIRKREVVSVPWDEVIFCSDKFFYMLGANEHGISGHILSEDKKTVKQTFHLGYSSFLKPTIDSYWEFIRRYMEEGPEAVKDAIPFYLPVEKRKETFKEGLIHHLSQTCSKGVFSLHGLGMILIDISSAIGRFVAMKTSKIPVWPEEVEKQCKIEQNDPINLSAENNPTWTWRKGWTPQHKGIYQ